MEKWNLVNKVTQLADDPNRIEGKLGWKNLIGSIIRKAVGHGIQKVVWVEFCLKFAWISFKFQVDLGLIYFILVQTGTWTTPRVEFLVVKWQFSTTIADTLLKEASWTCATSCVEASAWKVSLVASNTFAKFAVSKLKLPWNSILIYLKFRPVQCKVQDEWRPEQQMWRHQSRWR